MNMIKILAGAALVIASAGEIAAQSSQMALDFLANQWGQPLSDQYESAAKAASSAKGLNSARHLHPTHRRSEPPSPQDRDIIIAALKEPGSEDFIALEPGEV